MNFKAKFTEHFGLQVFFEGTGMKMILAHLALLTWIMENEKKKSRCHALEQYTFLKKRLVLCMVAMSIFTFKPFPPRKGKR